MSLPSRRGGCGRVFPPGDAPWPAPARAHLARLLVLVLVPVLASAGCVASRVRAADGEREPADTLALHYTIARPSDDSLAVRVRLELPPTRDTVTVLALPDAWAGRRALWANVIGVRALGGAAITPGADSAHRVVHAAVGAPITVEWTLRGTGAPPTPDSHNFSDITPHWAQLVGHDALVLPAVSKDTPVRATFVFSGLPAGSALATSFGSGTAPKDTVVVARGVLGDVAHAVYTAGLGPAVRAYAAAVPGGTVHVAIRGALRITDSALVDGVRRVVAAERTFWRANGPPSYVVTVGVAPEGSLGGTRLTNAFVADLDPTRPMDERVLMLFGHELMHEWIGSGALHRAPQLRDGELAWFTEGFTEYFSRRVLWRAGLLSDSVYVAAINGALRAQALSPARDLPWDSVVARYWTDDDAKQQPYLRGWLLALRLDAAVRQTSGGRRSLDDVLRGLLASERVRRAGLTDSSLITAFGVALGSPSRARHEVASALAGGALRIPSTALPASGDCVTSRVESLPRWDPGFDVRASLRAQRVQGVRAGSAAARAGLRDGMSIRGVSIYHGDPAKPIALDVLDDGRERRISYLPASGETVDVQVLTLARPRCLDPSL